MKLQPSEFFARQTRVREIGIRGQERLRSGRVALVGVGGVGSAIAFYLVRSGVGYLRLIDQDIIEPGNIHRLHCTSEKHLYRAKAEVAAEVLANESPWITLEPVVDTLRASNAAEILDGVDLVVDCLDNFRTRYVINRYSHDHEKAYLMTSAVANQGHVGRFRPPHTACLECAMPGVVDSPEQECESLGVTPFIVGLVGAIASGEAVKYLLNVPTELDGALLTIDMLGPEFVVSRLSKRPDCEACGDRAVKGEPEGSGLELLCGSNTVNVVPEQRFKLDLLALSKRLPEEDVVTVSNKALIYMMRGLRVAMFQNGRLLISGVDRISEVKRISDEIWGQVFAK